MTMYVWSDHHSYLAVAHAETIQKARAHLLATIGNPEGSAEHKHVIDAVTNNRPTIWHGANADYAIEGDNGNVFFS